MSHVELFPGNIPRSLDYVNKGPSKSTFAIFAPSVTFPTKRRRRRRKHWHDSCTSMYYTIIYYLRISRLKPREGNVHQSIKHTITLWRQHTTRSDIFLKNPVLYCQSREMTWNNQIPNNLESETPTVDFQLREFRPSTPNFTCHVSTPRSQLHDLKFPTLRCKLRKLKYLAD